MSSAVAPIQRQPGSRRSLLSFESFVKLNKRRFRYGRMAYGFSLESSSGEEDGSTPPLRPVLKPLLPLREKDETNFAWPWFSNVEVPSYVTFAPLMGNQYQGARALVWSTADFEFGGL